MKQSDTVNLVRLVAGSDYHINSVTEFSANITHVKCGHTFDIAISEIAKHGIRCSRCNKDAYVKMTKTVSEIKSLSLYEQCMAKLPKGFKIYGSTASEADVINVTWPGGDTFAINVCDLLNGTNLPDCLIERDSALVPSIQLQLMDKLMPTHLSILDDFVEMTDMVRVKDNITLSIDKYTINDLLERFVISLGKNN